MNPIRAQKDYTFSNTVAFTAGSTSAVTANSAIFDLGVAVPYPVTEKILLNVTTTAATGVNASTIGFALQHSATNNAANMTNVAEVGNPFLTITAAAASFAASSASIAIPPGIYRYIRVQATESANCGNAADGNFTTSLLF